MPKSRSEEYRVRLNEVHNRYQKNSQLVHVRIPKFLSDLWNEQKSQGMQKSYADVLSSALHFALLGPHPYTDPVDGLEDAFKQYVGGSQTKRETITKLISQIAKQYEIKITIEG